MRSDQFIEETARSLSNLRERFDQAVGGLDLAARSPGGWSAGQIVRHMNLANAAYLSGIQSALGQQASGTQESEIKHSFVGKLILRGAGPRGNAPVPKPLQPGEGPFGEEELRVWREQNEQIRSLLQRAAGTNPSLVSVRNPLFPLLRMNLADLFAIVAAHDDRHVRQLEAMRRT